MCKSKEDAVEAELEAVSLEVTCDVVDRGRAPVDIPLDLRLLEDSSVSATPLSVSLSIFEVDSTMFSWRPEDVEAMASQWR